MTVIRMASCFSGIGAPEVATPNWEHVWCAETDTHASRILASRFPRSINLGDVLAVDFIERARSLGSIDVLVGGPPCQAFSVAGLRKSLGDPRGNLSLRWVQIIHAIRPWCAVTENVPGWLSTPDNAFGCFLGELIGADDALPPPRGEGWPSAGMVSGPRARAAWRILDAQHFGLAQRRERVFVVVDFGDGPDPAAVLFERKGGAGDYSPRRKARENPPARVAGAAGRGALWRAVAAAFADPRFGLPEIAGTLGGASQSGGFRTTDLDNSRAFIPEVAWALQERDAKGADSDTKPGHLIPVALQPVPFDTTQITHPKNRSRPRAGHACHALAAGAHVPAIAIQERAISENINAGPDGAGFSVDLAYTLEARQTPQAIAMNIRGREGGAMPEIDDKASLRAASGGSSRSYVAFHGTQDPEVSGDIAPPLGTNGGQETALAYGWAVRRLTPNECARLQGFPDDHAAIPRPGKNFAADSPQYKAYGNSMAVPVIRWICKRIERERKKVQQGE